MLDGFDFLNEPDDLDEAAEGSLETPEDAEEVEETDDDADDGAQGELDGEEDSDDSDDDEGPEVVFIDGEEITLDQVKEWKDGSLRQQDYTKKTQDLAEQRKSLDAKMLEASGMIEALTAGGDEIKKLLVGDLDDIDLKALREDDYPEFLKVRDTIEERKSKFDKILTDASDKYQKEYRDEQGKILNDLMGWDDQEKAKQDIETFKSLAAEYDIKEGDLPKMMSAKLTSILIDHAKLKKASKAKPPKGKSKKVKFTSSSSTPKAKPASREERIDSFFS